MSEWIASMRNYAHYLLIIICLLSLTFIANASQTKAWGELNISGGLPDDSNWRYLFQSQSRYNFDPNQFQQELLLAGIGYQISTHITLWGGYQWASHDLFTGRNANNRLWEQLSWNTITDTIIFTSNSRFEQRALQGTGAINYRLRQRFILKFPGTISTRFFPVFSDEFLINFNRPPWVSTLTFDQNRALAGFDIVTSKHTFIETGYLNQTLFTTTGNQVNNIAYLGFFIIT